MQAVIASLNKCSSLSQHLQEMISVLQQLKKDVVATEELIRVSGVSA